MSFTEWLESLKQLGEITRIVAGLGFVTVFLAVLKHGAERRCWRFYKRNIRRWVDRQLAVRDRVGELRRRPSELSDDEWDVLCEEMLANANFSPLQMKQIMGMAVTTAKGIAAEKIFP